MTRTAERDTFAKRLQHLFDTVHPPDRGPYTQTEVVEAIRATGGTMTTGHMSQLLSGKRPSPSWTTLRDICRVFRVPMDYFNDDEVYEEIKRYIAWVQELQHTGGLAIAARTYPYGRRSVGDVAAAPGDALASPLQAGTAGSSTPNRNSGAHPAAPHHNSAPHHSAGAHPHTVHPRPAGGANPGTSVPHPSGNQAPQAGRLRDLP